MTIEFAVAAPVLIAVAVIAVNALSFFGECSAFDNVFRDTIRVYATSPANGQDIGQSASLAQESLAESFSGGNEEVHVTAEGVAGGLTRFEGTLNYWPTLFSLGLKREVFGVQMPPLSHRVQLSIDCYKPGVFL